MRKKEKKALVVMSGVAVHTARNITPDKKWDGNRVKFQMLGPLDSLEAAASVMLDRRIDGIYIPELKDNIDVTLSLVEHLPYTSDNGRTVATFRFEGKETTTVDGFVRGEFDTIRKTGWIELRRTMPKIQKK